MDSPHFTKWQPASLLDEGHELGDQGRIETIRGPIDGKDERGIWTATSPPSVSGGQGHRPPSGRQEIDLTSARVAAEHMRKIRLLL